jgi:hypothetical protein
MLPEVMTATAPELQGFAEDMRQWAIYCEKKAETFVAGGYLRQLYEEEAKKHYAAAGALAACYKRVAERNEVETIAKEIPCSPTSEPSNTLPTASSTT